MSSAIHIDEKGAEKLLEAADRQKEKPGEMFDDIALICPFCLRVKTCEDFGCCGESSSHFESHYVRYTTKKYVNSWNRLNKDDWTFVNPQTGETSDDPTDESRVGQ